MVVQSLCRTGFSCSQEQALKRWFCGAERTPNSSPAVAVVKRRLRANAELCRIRLSENHALERAGESPCLSGKRLCASNSSPRIVLTHPATVFNAYSSKAAIAGKRGVVLTPIKWESRFGASGVKNCLVKSSSNYSLQVTRSTSSFARNSL